MNDSNTYYAQKEQATYNAIAEAIYQSFALARIESPNKSANQDLHKGLQQLLENWLEATKND
jgi:hypothetical protein